MANIVVYDEGNGNVLDVIFSADTAKYTGRTDVLINPSEGLLISIPKKYLKVTGGILEEMTQAEKDAVNLADSNVADTNVRFDAKLSIDGFDPQKLILRSIIDVLISEINLLRQWIMQFKQDVNNASNLGDLKTSVASSDNLTDRTLNQAKSAIKNRIDSQDSTLDEKG